MRDLEYGVVAGSYILSRSFPHCLQGMSIKQMITAWCGLNINNLLQAQKTLSSNPYSIFC